MPALRMKGPSNQSGMALLEYSLIAAVFVGIFVSAGIYLKAAGRARADHSMNTAVSAIPCESGDGLSGEQCL